MPDALPQLSRRLELAQAAQNDRLNTADGGISAPLGGGYVHVRGDGHPLNQALGIVDAVSEEELIKAELLLAGEGGHPIVLEVSPAADPGLWPLLASRGYRVHQLQILWTRALSDLSPVTTDVEIRIARPEEERMFSQLVGAAFFGLDDWEASEPMFVTPLSVPGIIGCIALVNGVPAAGAMLGIIDGVALLSGDGVLPKFRGRGMQKALIAFRLQEARARGCDIACASTLPMTPSQRSYEACGFKAAYPKLEMARG
jgi:GNAT superfamily N-acetyltransferase